MADTNEKEEAKIKENVQRLRQIFEPLTMGLTPEVEPAVVYELPSPAPAMKTSHDD